MQEIQHARKNWLLTHRQAVGSGSGGRQISLLGTTRLSDEMSSIRTGRSAGSCSLGVDSMRRQWRTDGNRVPTHWVTTTMNIPVNITQSWSMSWTRLVIAGKWGHFLQQFRPDALLTASALCWLHSWKNRPALFPDQTSLKVIKPGSVACPLSHSRFLLSVFRAVSSSSCWLFWLGC